MPLTIYILFVFTEALTITVPHSAQESLKSIFELFGIAMHANSPTRISNTSSSMIDYVLSSFEFSLVDCSILAIGFSGHEAILQGSLKISNEESPHAY